MGKGLGVGPVLRLGYSLWGGEKLVKGQEVDEFETINEGFAALFLLSPIVSINSLFSKIGFTY